MKGSQTGFVIGLTMLLALALTGCGAAYPAEYRPDDWSQPSLCFAATGHTVSGNFLRYFEAMGGAEALGYPIAEPFEQEGRRVQYFEYALLEDHPDNPGGPVVKLSMLGERLGRQRPPVASSQVPNVFERGSRHYPQMGHTVSGDFLTFFEKKGGLVRFGYPIAEPLVVEGKLVQDFQRARFMWQITRHSGERVTLEPTGRVYFEAQELDRALLAPVPCPAASGQGD